MKNCASGSASNICLAASGRPRISRTSRATLVALAGTVVVYGFSLALPAFKNLQDGMIYSGWDCFWITGVGIFGAPIGLVWWLPNPLFIAAVNLAALAKPRSALALMAPATVLAIAVPIDIAPLDFQLGTGGIAHRLEGDFLRKGSEGILAADSSWKFVCGARATQFINRFNNKGLGKLHSLRATGKPSTGSTSCGKLPA